MFSGDEENRHVGEPLGHTSVITCVFFHDAKIYTGSMDMNIMCWDIETEKRDFTARGHEATVTCIYVDAFKMISGAADTKIIIWNKDNGEMIKVRSGNERRASRAPHLAGNFVAISNDSFFATRFARRSSSTATAGASHAYKAAPPGFLAAALRAR